MADKPKPKGDAATIQQLKKEKEDLEQDLREECRNFDKEKKHRVRLEKELEDEHAEREKAKQQAVEAISQLEAAKKENKKAKEVATTSSAEAESARKEMEKAKKELMNAHARIETERKENEIAKQEVTRLAAIADAEKKGKEKVQQELQRAITTADNVKAQNDRLVQEAAAKFESERREKERALHIANELETTSAGLKKEKEIYQQKYQQLDKEKRELSEVLDLLRTENANLKKELTQLKEYAEREKNQILDREAETVNRERKHIKWGPHKDRAWTVEEVKRLRKLVLTSRRDSAGNKINLKILVFGPTGNGKSSLCNGFRSAIYGNEQPTTYYAVADGTESLTSGFQGAQYGDHWIIDMAGIFETRKIDSSSINDILSGKIPFYADITDNLEVRDKSQMELPPPGKNDVACVVLVLKYEMDLGPEIKRQIDTVIKLAGKGVVSFHLVITRLDECDPLFNDTEQLPHLYKSEKVQAAVQRISEETGITPLSISFVKNYVRETETDTNTFILHLRVLEKILFSAVEQVEKRIDQKRQRNMYKIKYCSSCNCILVLSLILLILGVLTALFWPKIHRLYKGY